MRGATYRRKTLILEENISIHAPRERCDLYQDLIDSGTYEFQSTHPVRGATYRRKTLILEENISIHAPRERCDLLSSLML
ncbi:protein of unknown function [Ruminococcaceae bacterium BL-4]|nr:protein of unknown function [Ruminococcaceae bacterium BL-4]